MNGAELHLLVNHVSLFALILGAVALAVSMKRGSAELRVLASVLFVVAGVFAGITFLSGEEAEEVLMPLDEETEPLVERHEQSANWALRSGILVGILALAVEWAARRKQRWFKPLQWALLVFALHGCTVFATTAWLGGEIRHTEIRD
jgi:uncharacterized membrane protein